MKHYRTINITTKNKKGEIFYREAIAKELDRFIGCVINGIKQNYTTIKEPFFKVNNNIRKIKNSIEDLIEFFRIINDKRLKTFLKNSLKIIYKWSKILFKQQNRIAKQKFKKAYKSITITSIKDKKILNILKLNVDYNVNLIKDITQDNLNKIQNIVYNASLKGQGWYEIEKELSKQQIINKKRVKIIARDQTAKITEEINRIQSLDAGIDYFEWDTCHDERVSKEHKKLQGKIFRWNEPIKERLPIIDSSGNRGYPAERVNCRCTGLCILVDEGYEMKWNREKESYEAVKII